MSADIHLLPGLKAPDRDAHAQPIEDVVALLRGLLAEAEAGEVRASGIAWVGRGGNIYRAFECFAPEGLGNLLTAAVTLLQTAVVNKMHSLASDKELSPPA